VDVIHDLGVPDVVDLLNDQPRLRARALSAATMIVLIAAWYLTDVGQAAPLYPSLHLIGLIIILVLRGRIADLIHSKDAKKISIGVALTAFPSTLVGHLLGGIIFITLLHPAPALFMSTLPIAVMERTFLTLLATVIGAPLIIIVRRSYPRFEQP
jgi:formate/nitrite transporter FocA (FNT family)